MDEKQTGESHEIPRTDPAPFWSRRGYWMTGVAVAALLAATVAVPAVMAHRGFGGGGRHGFGHGLQDPEQARERAAFAIEWAFRAVDGTEAQRQEARVVADRVIDELAPIASRHRDNREAMVRELVRPQVDRAALESLREQELLLADEASRVAVAAVADLAEVLTPEQRAELVSLAHRFHGSEPSR